VIVAASNVGAVIVRADEPLTVPYAAVIVVLPALPLVAKPPLMVAATVFKEVQVTAVVRSWFVPSE
jgi:hypothetical protein